MRRLAALLLCGLAGCATEFEGEKPSSLYGQNIGAAEALYGPWSDRMTLDGREYYLWRRRLDTSDGPKFCELRLEVSARKVIARRLLQGFPGACELFTARFIPVDRK